MVGIGLGRHANKTDYQIGFTSPYGGEVGIGHQAGSKLGRNDEMKPWFLNSNVKAVVTARSTSAEPVRDRDPQFAILVRHIVKIAINTPHKESTACGKVVAFRQQV